MSRDPIRTLVFRLTSVTLAILLALSLMASWMALQHFERVLFPELRLKGEAVAEIMARQINRALDYDIPLAELPGLPEALVRAIEDHPDIAYIAVEGLQGEVIAEHGRRVAAQDVQLSPTASAHGEILLPLIGDGVTMAWLRLSLDPGWLARASTDLMLEVASVILVSVLVTFEVLLLIVHLSVRRKGMKTPEPRTLVPGPRLVDAVRVRLPVFLFCMAEELSRPFMPAYAQALAPSAPWLPVDLAVSLPIALFMLVWALSQPFGAQFSSWLGRRRAFLLASILAATGLLMAALADDLLAFIFWRCVTALGYGIVLITAQGLVVDNTGLRNRASGLAHFVGALLAAGVCGPIAGGIIADQVGFSVTLMISAGIALLAGGVVMLLFPRPVRDMGMNIKSPQSMNRSAIFSLVRDWRFTSLMLLSAIPAKIAATGILFCLIPLVMVDMGADNAEIGRVQMMYFLMFIIVSPLAASLSDRWQSRRGFIVAGGLATMLALMPMALDAPAWLAALVIGLFGLAQALLSAPQLSLVTQIAPDVKVSEISAIGWYRLLERLGGAAGPVLAMGLAAIWSYHQALVALGVICGFSALLFWVLSGHGRASAERLETGS